MDKFETAYVVQLHNFASLADAQPCFRFDHPNPEVAGAGSEASMEAGAGAGGAGGGINQRYCKLQFVIDENAVMHGFAGYFESQLFGEHNISINPASFSTGMFSWCVIVLLLSSCIKIRSDIQ